MVLGLLGAGFAAMPLLSFTALNFALSVILLVLVFLSCFCRPIREPGLLVGG